MDSKDWFFSERSAQQFMKMEPISGILNLASKHKYIQLIFDKDSPCFSKEDNIFYFCPSYLPLRFMGTVNVVYYLVSVCAIIFS